MDTSRPLTIADRLGVPVRTFSGGVGRLVLDDEDRVVAEDWDPEARFWVRTPDAGSALRASPASSELLDELGVPSTDRTSAGWL